MKGKTKVVLLGAFLVFDLVVIALIAGWIMIDRIAARGIEAGASHALAVPTEVERADVDIMGGRFELAGLRVGNPQGFDAPHFVRLGEGRVGVTLGSLMGDVVELPVLRLEDLDVHLQRREGRSNYGVILDNLDRFERGERQPADAGAKKFVIRSIEIRDISVHADMLPVGGELTRVSLTIPEITLHDVGSGGEPLTLAEITGLVVKALLTAAVDVGGGVLPEQVVDEMQGELAGLIEIGAEGVEMATSVLSEVTGRAEGAAERAGEAADELRGILRGEKQEAEPQDPG